MTADREEQLAVVDRDGRIVGSAPRSVVRRDNLPHAVVAVLLRDPAGRVYVHRRTDTKDVFPGLHDCFAAGGVQAARSPPTPPRGRSPRSSVPTAWTWRRSRRGGTRTSRRGTSGTATWRRTTAPVVHQPEEVAWGTWMTVDDLRAHLADPTWPFVPDGRELVDELLATGRLA